MGKINARILTKYDTLENWSTKNPKLLQGELALVNPGVTAKDGSATILLKSGLAGTDGAGVAFNDCPYLWANAADVYAWAKAATKPSYTWTEIKDRPNIPTVNNGALTITVGSTKYTFTANQAGSTNITLGTAATANSDAFDYKGAADWAKVDLIGKTGDASTVNTFNGLRALVSEAKTEANNNAATALSKANDAATAASNAQKTADSGVTKATAAQTAADNAQKTANSKASMNEVNNAINTAIGKITQFDIQVVESLPTNGIKGVIYLIKHSHGDKDNYDEYIWNTAANPAAFEKIGNTDVNLSGYVPTSRKINGQTLTKDLNVGTVTSVGSGNGLTGGTITTSGTISHAVPTGAKETGTGFYKISTDGFGHVNGVTAVTPKDITDLGIAGRDEHVTSAANHYSPATDSNSTLSKSAGSGKALSNVTINRDPKGHVTGLSVSEVSLPSVGNGALKDAKGTTFFTANQSGEFQIDTIYCGSASDLV